MKDLQSLTLLKILEFVIIALLIQLKMKCTFYFIDNADQYIRI